MTNKSGKTTLGLNIMEVILLLDGLECQITDTMTEAGHAARIKLLQRLTGAYKRLEYNDSLADPNANPWSC